MRKTRMVVLLVAACVLAGCSGPTASPGAARQKANGQDINKQSTNGDAAQRPVSADRVVAGWLPRHRTAPVLARRRPGPPRRSGRLSSGRKSRPPRITVDVRARRGHRVIYLRADVLGGGQFLACNRTPRGVHQLVRPGLSAALRKRFYRHARRLCDACVIRVEAIGRHAPAARRAADHARG